MTAVQSTLPHMPEDNARIDLRMEALHLKLAEIEFPLRRRASVFNILRMAYMDGYLDAFHDERALTDEIPMLRYPQLFLP